MKSEPSASESHGTRGNEDALAARLHQSRNGAHDWLYTLETQIAFRSCDGGCTDLDDEPARRAKQLFPLGFHFVIFSHSKDLVQRGWKVRATTLNAKLSLIVPKSRKRRLPFVPAGISNVASASFPAVSFFERQHFRSSR